ncbi:32393_t:CDS:1, partial [Racocetra persica]
FTQHSLAHTSRIYGVFMDVSTLNEEFKLYYPHGRASNNLEKF